jgi:2-iminobutanoate/2-iminopropanoate deaminase
MRRSISTPHAPAPTGAYSQAIVCGPFLFVAGQTPRRHDGTVESGGIAAQTVQVIANVQAVLEAAGMTLDDVVKVTVHLSDLALFGAFNAAYCRCFREPYPARTTVQSGLTSVLIEMDVIAYRPDSHS